MASDWLGMWRDLMYDGARQMWPGLTPQQFGDAARAWIARQSGTLSIQQVAVGLEQELARRHGQPRRST